MPLLRYDTTRCAVRFLQFEETAILNPFGSNSALIYATAAKVYSRGPKGSYDIIAAEFQRHPI
jgi:hypothetical protein